MSAASSKISRWFYPVAFWMMFAIFFCKQPLIDHLGTAPILGTTSTASVYQARTTFEILSKRSSMIRVQISHGSEIGGRYDHHFDGRQRGRRASFDGRPLRLVEKDGIPCAEIPIEFSDGPSMLHVAIGPKME